MLATSLYNIFYKNATKKLLPWNLGLQAFLRHLCLQADYRQHVVIQKTASK